MVTARAVAHPAFRVAPVPRRLFGSFVEHMGRCVYTGIYEPGHPTADEDGLRGDVLALTRELGVTVVRYPGGNYASAYRWEDTVGPRDARPTRLDPAWHSIETNEFGLDEFVRWCRAADVEPMLAVNLGTRGVQAAMDLVEYANHPHGTALSDLRVQHGAKAPYDVRMWCLGNELDGPWQTGHKTAEEYGRLAAETANALHQLDPDLSLVACGSSNAEMPTFGEWERVVLEHAYDHVDHLSLHAYYEQHGEDRASFLASGVGMDRFVEAVVATADAVRARRGASKRMQLSFDEWNVWYQGHFQQQGPPPDWTPHPRLVEDEYTVVDAVVVGDLLLSLLRHADRVDTACQAQLVNVIGPIRSEPGGPAWRQTTFHPFAQAAAHARGDVLRVETDVPTVRTDRYGDVPLVDLVVTADDDGGSPRLGVLVVNRDQDGPATLELDVSGWPGLVVERATSLWDDDPAATNSAAHPDRVRPRPLDDARVESGRLTATLPPVSWSVLQLG